MNPNHFWTSQDGQILTVKNLDDNTLGLTLAFWPRNPSEFAFFKDHLEELNFTERSILARIGIEMRVDGKPRVDGKRLVLDAEAFIYDQTFPNAAYWKKLLRIGTRAGRLFYAPEQAKLSTEEIWDAIKHNLLKLPNTISIDSEGRVFIKPHQVVYTLSSKLKRSQFERVVSGSEGRKYLERVQLRKDTPMLIIPPRSGVLTSCSMYLKEHYVLLNRGSGNFGVHTSAVLLDPIKTFGTNIMLEIFNPGAQPVVNPMVSVEVFHAQPMEDPELKLLKQRRVRLLDVSRKAFQQLEDNPPKAKKGSRPRTRISVMGESAAMDNHSILIRAGAGGASRALAANLDDAGHRTLIEALDEAPPQADTLIVDYFPNLMEHLELLTRLPKHKLRRIIFRKPSRDHGFFHSNNAHSRLEVYQAIGIDVHWYSEMMDDVYIHTYKKERGFFIRDELINRFQESTILAFYGSAFGLGQEDTDRISSLIDKLTGFIGDNVGVLTGGGGGVMRLAIDQAREKGALTGACFLELEAQPPELGVDFFNTFQETARHNRQKWFEAADFCIFNVGGVGTLEEIGIEMCNLKLGIRPRVPYVFYNAHFWKDLRSQLKEMIKDKRAPEWIGDYILFSDDPEEVVTFYRKALQVL